jgi:Na+-transporting NADH:ubiquinone oxidoreductase subunit A
MIAIGGPQAANPRLVKTLLGADINELLAKKPKRRKPADFRLGPQPPCRAGARLSGRFHLQVSVVQEGREKELFGWVLPVRKILRHPHHAGPLPA